ncbi:MAG: hypothetical protein IPL16_14470 [Ignavibacteria bacterium]|nr:hypothetical protein [Ignavibacteria bacterium]
MNKKKQSINHNNYSFAVDVELIILKEGKFYVAYCPAMELSSYANYQPSRYNIDSMSRLFKRNYRRITKETLYLPIPA